MKKLKEGFEKLKERFEESIEPVFKDRMPTENE
jgi:hypothetical protein